MKVRITTGPAAAVPDAVVSNARAQTMNFRISLFIALATVSTASASATEAVWPKNSAGELSLFVALLRFGIYADHCSVQVPHLKPGFEGLMKALDTRIQEISKGLLASDAFKGMKDKPVPPEIIDALKDSFDDMKHNVERRDAASICPETLQNLGETDDETLKHGLTEILTAVQTMSRNLEREKAR
jgi:hypothetical protein